MSPFDFEDPERMLTVPFPVEHDIVHTLGVRMTRDKAGWVCPHGRMWSLDDARAALDCLTYCTPEGLA